MVLSKDDFCKIIKRLEDYTTLQNTIDDLFKKLIDNEEQDFCNSGGICIGHETPVIKLLEVMFEDFDTLSWWIYERNYGKNFKIGDMLNDNVPVDLSTAEKLYDYLLENLVRKGQE